ncbi:NUDIX domain-containing protein [Micromonospora sp. NPDC049559]|uniref:NUDIX hydrolase n=1 Tax=Micromonospora sp. NPDC049559 TaxID=3155923 RepID=UPI00342AC785
MLDALYADAVRSIDGWRPEDADGAEARDRTLRLLDAGPAALTRNHLPGHLTASALVLDASGERVLLCLHPRVGRWVQLGGHCEPGDETLAGVALREATEESGIDGLWLDPTPIDLDVHQTRCAGGALHHDLRFVAVAPPGAVARISAESTALDWFAPDALPEPLGGATARLVAPALAALRRTPLRPAP